MTVDLLKLFVAFGNVIGSIYYFIFDWTNDFRWPIEQINAFILRSSLYWRLKFSNEDGIVYAYKFLLQRSRKYDE